MSEAALNNDGAMDSDNEQGISAEEEVQNLPPPQFNFVIATDNMTAYLRVVVYHRDQIVSKEEIMEALEKKGIKYGIDEVEIDRYLAEGNYLKELRAASGKRPVKGEDGSIEFHFKQQMTGRPKEREDGSVDFKDLDIVQNVSRGDLLCTLTKPKEGVDGTDIFGATVKAKAGDMPQIPGGEKVKLSEDESQIIADADGGLHFKGNTIFIEEVLTVKENVGVETGNIDYNGSVVVYGNVNEGYTVKAKDDITVNGIVEGATLEAGGNILIRNGINGMGKAYIFAEGDVSSVFIENAEVKCGHNLYSNAVMNSRLNAGSSIILRGKKGAVLGGVCRAGECINARTFGNEKNISQDIVVDPLWYEYEKLGLEEPPENPEIRLEKLEKRRERLLEEASKISSETSKLQREPKEYEEPVSAEEKNKQMRDIIIKKSKVTSQIAAIDKEMKEIEAFYRGHEFKVICIGEAFPGTKVSIGSAKYKVTTMMQNQKFYVDRGEISLGAVLPHEVDVD